VLGKRPDGYHNIRSLMIPLDFGDDVRIELEEGDRRILCECDDPLVPDGEANLAYKAARAFMDETGKNFDIEITITKRIPVAAGLAGGSGNAAAVLRVLNRYTEDMLDSGILDTLALSVGSDVPFMLKGKPAWVEGRGEVVKPASVPEHFVYLVINPGFGVSTEWVYSNLALTTEKIERNIGYSINKDIRLINDLEIPVFQRYPEVKEYKKRIVASGASAALMSGSGPSLFGVFESFEAAESLGCKLARVDRVSYFTARVAS